MILISEERKNKIVSDYNFVKDEILPRLDHTNLIFAGLKNS